jgi:DmsE family decaheme c-type cytochrome
MPRASLIAIAVGCGFVLSIVDARPSLSDPTAQTVGSEACKECHEKEYQQYMISAHGRAQKDGGVLPSSMECETCHGPGSLHVAANGDDKAPGFNTMHRLDKVPPAEANAVCLKCHNTGEQFYWQNGMHARRDMACVQCHSMHSSKDPGHSKLLKAENTSMLCATCHRERKLTSQKSAHMPLREGEMDCASCHNPHGTPTPKMLRANTVNDLCTTCHADRRGPFLWEHPPVRENCLTCHDPHGSNNDKLLVSRRPYLCQRCHIGSGHPSALYSAGRLSNNRLENRSCQNCHSQIHGSNSPSGRDFTR